MKILGLLQSIGSGQEYVNYSPTLGNLMSVFISIAITFQFSQQFGVFWSAVPDANPERGPFPEPVLECYRGNTGVHHCIR